MSSMINSNRKAKNCYFEAGTGQETDKIQQLEFPAVKYFKAHSHDCMLLHVKAFDGFISHFFDRKFRFFFVFNQNAGKNPHCHVKLLQMRDKKYKIICLQFLSKLINYQTRY